MHGTMERGVSAKAGKSPENSEEDSEFSEAMRLVKLAAEPHQVGDTIKRQINRAADRLGFTPGRAEDIWRGEARRIDSSEMDALRAIEQQRDHAAERFEQRRHLQQLSALRAKLEFDDPDFHAADIEAIKYVIEAAK